MPNINNLLQEHVELSTVAITYGRREASLMPFFNQMSSPRPPRSLAVPYNSIHQVAAISRPRRGYRPNGPVEGLGLSR